jgi:hypothetical protein
MPEHTPQYFRSYSPKHRVKFINSATGEEIIDASNDLISISTNKAYGRAAGTWQLMLTFKTVTDAKGKEGRYDELITTDDTITIELDAGDGSGMKVVMLGLVDRTGWVRPGGNNPQRQVKISGQDMGKLLLKHDVGWDIIAFNQEIAKAKAKEPLATTESGDSQNQKYSTQLNRQFDQSLTVGTPGALIQKLFDLAFKAVLPFWADKVQLAVTTKDDWKLWSQVSLTLQGCTAWAAFTRCMHDPFNLLTTETLDTKHFIVTLEEQPIDDNGRLNRSADRVHTIYDADIIADDIGVCDVERINMIFYQPQFYMSAVGETIPIAMADANLVRPEIKPGSPEEKNIQLHGYNPKPFQDQFVPPETEWRPPMVKIDRSTWLGSASVAATKLWNWYKNNHTYWSGTIQTHLRPDIKVGDGLIHDLGNKKMEYLIEQVAHHYTVWPQPQFVTTLQVTRGQQINAPNSAIATQTGGNSYA